MGTYDLFARVLIIFQKINFISPRGRAELARQGSLADRQFDFFSISKKIKIIFEQTSGNSTFLVFETDVFFDQTLLSVQYL